jgi:hypothetical protein
VALAEVAAALTSGTVPAAIVPGAPNLAFQLSKGDFPNLQMVKTYQPKYIFNVALGLRTGDPLLAKIDASLANLKANGTVKTTKINPKVDIPVPPTTGFDPFPRNFDKLTPEQRRRVQEQVLRAHRLHPPSPVQTPEE